MYTSTCNHVFASKNVFDTTSVFQNLFSSEPLTGGNSVIRTLLHVHLYQDQSHGGTGIINVYISYYNVNPYAGGG